MIENHPFDPFVPESSEVLILGSFPGKESTQVKREDDWFYGANRNQFWKILALVYGQSFENKSQKQLLFRKAKIAITDIILSCERKNNSNSDINLSEKEYNKKEIYRILNENPIRKILFTSQWVQNEFLEHFEKPNEIELIRLPSPSPISRRLNINDKASEFEKHLPNI